MKKSIFCLLFSAFCLTVFASPDSLYNAATIGQATRNQKAAKGLQVGAVGSTDTLQANGYGLFDKSVAIGGGQNGNSLLTLTSTTKGFLPMRMNTTQQNAISLPANGLTIYNTDSNALVRYDAADGWRMYHYGNMGGGGATGPTGPTGAVGSNGATGATGPTGADGSLNAWSLTGNAGTTAGTNFIGTTDAMDFVLKTNGIGRARFGSDGTLNIQSQLSSTVSAFARYDNNYFGFGIPAALFGDSTADGFNGLTVIDGTLLGIGKNTGSVGFTSHDQSQYARLVWTYKADNNAVVSLQAKNSDTTLVLNIDQRFGLNYELTIGGHELRFTLPTDTAPVGYHLAVATNFGDGGIQMGFVRSDSLNSFQLVDGTQANGYVLTSDADGLGSWQPNTGPTISSGTSAPATTPGKVGDIYVNTSSKKLYFATGTSSSSDWEVAN